MPCKKLVFITNIPNHYRIPLFNELQRKLAEHNWELHVIFGAMGYQGRLTDVNLSECQFNYSVLNSGVFHSIERKTGFLFYVGLLSQLKKLHPTQVFVAGFSLSTIKLAMFKPFFGYSYHIVSGSLKAKGAFRTWLRKALLKRAEGAVAYGSLAKAYFEGLGANPQQVVKMGNTVDTDFFASETKKLKGALAKSNPKHLTYVGYLNARKNVGELIHVLKELITLRQDVVLDIIGAGDNLTQIKNLVDENGLNQFVKFHGFKQKEELPKYLCTTDVFLFQTDADIWGLVLNEAMAAGIPCIASVNAGATSDLIEEGVTGFSADFTNHNAVAQQIDWMLSHPKEMNELGARASSFIEKNYSLEACANRLISALRI